LLARSDASKISDEERIRLLILYSLRYEKSSANQTVVLLDALRQSGMSEKKLSFVDDMLKYAGADKRMDEVYSNQDILTKTKNVLKGLKVKFSTFRKDAYVYVHIMLCVLLISATGV
jgi:vacuolar protein sorting-associated protein 45